MQMKPTGNMETMHIRDPNDKDAFLDAYIFILLRMLKDFSGFRRILRNLSLENTPIQPWAAWLTKSILIIRSTILFGYTYFDSLEDS